MAGDDPTIAEQHHEPPQLINVLEAIGHVLGLVVGPGKYEVQLQDGGFQAIYTTSRIPMRGLPAYQPALDEAWPALVDKLLNGG